MTYADPRLTVMRHMIANPRPDHFTPAANALAWGELKRARGQMIDYDRIGPSAHIVKRPAQPSNATL